MAGASVQLRALIASACLSVKWTSGCGCEGSMQCLLPGHRKCLAAQGVSLPAALQDLLLGLASSEAAAEQARWLVLEPRQGPQRSLRPSSGFCGCALLLWCPVERARPAARWPARAEADLVASCLCGLGF